jgi:ribonucleotide reductase alpha subunit
MYDRTLSYTALKFSTVFVRTFLYQSALLWCSAPLFHSQQDVDAAIQTYHMMSRKLFTHATPTLFNSGCPKPQMSSCFLLTMKEDSIEGIYDTLKSCASISK